ncbi:hypothetical protein B0H14DRAFT_3586664 [Mycena olivaceomarginata]|nr:hypothetical protein B0H14DRAFT_3586664 [Mycena olivaceomarginata]
MPEKGVIRLFLREIKWEEYELLKKKIHRDHQDDDEYFSGRFVTHPECCAQVSGNRQTFTIHVTPPNDPNLEPLLHPRPAAPPKKTGKGMKPMANTAASQPRFYCSTCHTSADVEEEEDDNDVRGTEIKGVDLAVKLNPSHSDASPSSEYLKVPAAEYVNDLGIEGRLLAVHHGKEIVLAIVNTVEERTVSTINWERLLL